MTEHRELNLDRETFLAQYWQSKPLLIRNALPGFTPPLDKHELSGLALEDDVESRIIECHDHGWQLYHGPFHAGDFQRDKPWTLLVQAVDHYIPAVAALRKLVDFIPQWRVDDVMVSYAVDGGSVGPHFDNYDVFLLQGEGERLWKLGSVCDHTTPLLPHDELRILCNFETASVFLAAATRRTFSDYYPKDRTMDIRPRRSLLYMPGSNPRALDKARSLPADGLILDMEDSVAPDAKQLARDQVGAVLAQGGYGHRELIVRINALSTEWGPQDIEAVSNFPTAPDAVLIPKVNSARDVVAAISAFERAGCPDSVAMWIMAETPLCILHIAEVASAHPRLAGMVLGTSDLSKDTRVRHTPDRLGFIAALNLCVYAARANDLTVIDGVQLDLHNEELLRASCAQGRDLGFDGKSLIHPNQIAAANAAFAPDEEEVAAASAIIAAFEQARAQGKGVVVVNGRLVENLHVEEAQRQLALAAAIARISAEIPADQ